MFFLEKHDELVECCLFLLTIDHFKGVLRPELERKKVRLFLDGDNTVSCLILQVTMVNYCRVLLESFFVDQEKGLVVYETDFENVHHQQCVLRYRQGLLVPLPDIVNYDTLFAQFFTCKSS